MKILVLSHMYPVSFNSISGIFVHKQVKALTKAGIEVRVVSPVPWAPWPIKHLSKKWKGYAVTPDRDEVEGITVHYPRHLAYPRAWFFSTSGERMYRGIKDIVAEVSKEFPFELIHAHVAIPDGYAASKISKNFDCPFVVTIHGQDFQQTIFRNLACLNSIGQTISKANMVITVSTKLQQIGIRDFQNEKRKFTVVPNGINPGDFIDLNVQKGNDPIGVAPLIVSVSNLVSTKGIDLNIKAVHQLRNKYPRIRYFIIGDGNQRTELENLSMKLELGNIVQFLGRVEHKQALHHISQCDVFSMPSWKEGFGVVYLEAMACGKPVIGCKGEGIEDFVEHGKTGMLVKPHDVEDLVKALDFLLNNPEEASVIGQRSQKVVLAQYTWEKNAEKTIGIYKSVLTK